MGLTAAAPSTSSSQIFGRQASLSTMTAPMSFTVQRHRSTRAEILARDVEVQNLVLELRRSERRNWDILAECIERCHAASFARTAWRSSSEVSSGATGRYRCKTLACPSCGAGIWRKAINKTLCGFHDTDANDLSIVTVAGSCVTDMEAVRVEVRRMRRSLRDLRDAQAEKRALWREIRIAGLVNLMPVPGHGAFLVQPVARLLVHHRHVPRSSVERVMRDRVVGSGRDVDVRPYREVEFVSSPPGVGLPVASRAVVVAVLFEWGRGTEPFRIAVGPQGRSRSGAYPMARPVLDERAAVLREPMPIVF